MKKIILIIMVALATNFYGQTMPKPAGINSQFNNNDTTNRFIIVKGDLDVYRQKFVDYWGAPEKNTTGQIIWNNIEIKNVGKEIKIVLTDWLCETEYVGSHMQKYCKLFVDQKDKDYKLMNLHATQTRELLLILTDKYDQNIINTPDKRQLVIELLDKIVLPQQELLK